MKTVKAICAASVIALSLSLPAYADDTTPGDQHVPGMTAPAPADTGTTTAPAADTGLTGGAAAVDGDMSFSALADMLWTLASIF